MLAGFSLTLSLVFCFVEFTHCYIRKYLTLVVFFSTHVDCCSQSLHVVLLLPVFHMLTNFSCLLALHVLTKKNLTNRLISQRIQGITWSSSSLPTIYYTLFLSGGGFLNCIETDDK